ncbi:MAG: hypothetical protein IJD61_02500, partial [Clostridia bacterium]|nr:hypothetical protein [Clostridia bacterium]
LVAAVVLVVLAVLVAAVVRVVPVVLVEAHGFPSLFIVSIVCLYLRKAMHVKTLRKRKAPCC